MNPESVRDFFVAKTLRHKRKLIVTYPEGGSFESGDNDVNFGALAPVKDSKPKIDGFVRLSGVFVLTAGQPRLTHDKDKAVLKG